MVQDTGSKIYESQRLSIFAARKSDHSLFHPEGELTIYTVKAAKEKLLDCLQTNAGSVLNLSKIHEIDSAGFQLLLFLKREAQYRKKRLRYISHSPSVLSILDLYGAVGLLGDQIVVPAETRKNYSFSYGLKKQKLYP